MKKKTFALLLSLVLIFGVVAGGTFAWLVDKSAEVKNTFTYGDINIDLTETLPENRQAKIIPGVDIAKDPKVTVKANSEACWLFVKVEETGDFVTGKVTYSVRTGDGNWTRGDGTKIPSNVYYREVNASTDAQDFYILTGKGNVSDDTYNGVINVSGELTKAEVNGIKTNPTLSFLAAAVQKDNRTLDQAWTLAKGELGIN